MAGRSLVPLKQIKEGAKPVACREGIMAMLEVISYVYSVFVISQAYNAILGKVTWSGVEEDGTGCIQ